MELRPEVCPHCGARLDMKNAGQILHCDYCDSDIFLDGNDNNTYSEAPADRQVSDSGIKYQEYEKRLKIWNRKFTVWAVVYGICVFLFTAMVMNDSSSDAAILPFLVGLGIFFVVPVVMGKKKPEAPDSGNKGRLKAVLTLCLILTGVLFAALVIAAVMFG